jgi:hypothetical protein
MMMRHVTAVATKRSAECINASLKEASQGESPVSCTAVQVWTVRQGDPVTMPCATNFWGVFVTREHVRHNKSGITVGL